MEKRASFSLKSQQQPQQSNAVEMYLDITLIDDDGVECKFKSGLPFFTNSIVDENSLESVILQNPKILEALSTESVKFSLREVKAKTAANFSSKLG